VFSATHKTTLESGLLEVMLIVVPVKEALELHKDFVQTVAKFSVARMVCLGSNVALKILDIIK
jgi:hypothetical protein